MSEFTIEIKPHIPPPTTPHPDSRLEELDLCKVSRILPGEYSISYRIDGSIFEYYPASMLTTLNDIYHERFLFRSRVDHDMTLSGYTVLNVSFSGEFARFFDPLKMSPEGDTLLSLAEFDVMHVQREFDQIAYSLWEFVQKALA